MQISPKLSTNPTLDISGFGHIWQRYLDNGYFVAAHVLIAIFSLIFFLLWWRQRNSIANQAPVSVRSEAMAEGLLAPLDHYAGYFDFCSSAFIFVGLLGTIAGFAGALSFFDPNARQFDVKPIERALSTSFMGIAWAIMLNLFVTVFDYLQIRPLGDKLRQRVSGDVVETTIKEHLNNISASLRQTLEGFQMSASEVASAIGGWKSEIDVIAVKYTAIASEMAATNQSFGDTYKLLKDLPGEVSRGLARTLESGNQSLVGVINRIRESLEAFESLPVRIEKGIDNSFIERKQVLDRVLEAYVQQLSKERASLDDLFRQVGNVPIAVATSLDEGRTRTAQVLEKGYEDFLTKLRAAVQTTVQDQLSVLSKAAGDLSLNANELQQKWASVLSREEAALRDAMVNAMSVSRRAVEEQREQFLKMESALPESLATTFAELIAKTQASSALLQQTLDAQARSSEQLEKSSVRFDQTISRIEQDARRLLEDTARQARETALAAAEAAKRAAIQTTANNRLPEGVEPKASRPRRRWWDGVLFRRRQ